MEDGDNYKELLQFLIEKSFSTNNEILNESNKIDDKIFRSITISGVLIGIFITAASLYLQFIPVKDDVLQINVFDIYLLFLLINIIFLLMAIISGIFGVYARSFFFLSYKDLYRKYDPQFELSFSEKLLGILAGIQEENSKILNSKSFWFRIHSILLVGGITCSVGAILLSIIIYIYKLCNKKSESGNNESNNGEVEGS